MYYDAVYLDDTWHRVVISEGSTWATRGNVEVQIPAQWNDGKIVVSANLGGLNPASPLFLYVVDANGVANENGYPLSSESIPSEQPSGSLIVIYPNPTSDTITIEVPKVENGWAYRIITATGQIVRQGTIQNPTSTLNLKTLSSGVYFIQLISEQQTQTIRVIKK